MTEKRKKKKLLRIVLWVTGGIVLLVLLSFLTLFFLVFEPLEWKAPLAPTREDLHFHSRLLGRTMHLIARGRKQPEKLLLNQAHLDSVLRLFDNTWETLHLEEQIHGILPPRYWQVRLQKNGRVSIVVPYQTSWRCLRGGIIFLRGTGILKKELGGDWTFRVEEASAGRLPLSAEWLTERINGALAKRKTSEYLQQLDAAIERFEVDSSAQIRIIYRPSEFRDVLRRTPLR